MLFQWTHLSLHQFRLLEVRPLISITKDLSFVLRTFTFNTSSIPPYAALAYSTPYSPALEAKNHSVVLNGRSFAIHKNCLDALKKVGGEYEYLWCEDLCVNMRDSEELRTKDHIRREVFQGATTIIGFLNDTVEGSEEFCKLAKSLRSSHAIQAENAGSLQKFLCAVDDLRIYHTSGDAMVESPWVRKGTEVVLYVGDTRLDREGVEKAVEFVNQSHTTSAL